MNLRIALLAGDGIGPEITAEARRTLDRTAERFGHRFEYREAPVGAAAGRFLFRVSPAGSAAPGKEEPEKQTGKLRQQGQGNGGLPQTRLRSRRRALRKRSR